MTQTADVPSTDVQQRGLHLARLGLAAAMVSRLAGRLVGILLVVVLAREASPSTVALYGYLLGTATLVLILTDLGVATVAAREVAAGRLPARGALRAALPIQLVSVLGAAALTVVLTVIWGPDGAPPAAVALTVLFVVVGGMNNLWAELLRSTGRVMLEGGLEIASSAVLVVAGVLVVQHGGSITALTAVVAGKEAAVLLVSWAVLRPRRHPDVRSRPLLTQGMWIALAGTALVLLVREGMLILGGLGTVGALATYVVATRFFDAGVTIAHTVGFGLGPGMAALAGDPAAFRSAARKYVGLLALLGVAAGVVGVLVAGPLTTVPFGARWEVAVPSVRVIALAGLPLLLSYVSFTLLMARNQLRWLALSTVAATVVGVGTTVGLVLSRPTALSAVIGTTVGLATLAVLLLAGLRDLFRPVAAVRA
jgi:O-antigen/teichoic acid export membrane protein